jgi:uncharacterized protein
VLPSDADVNTYLYDFADNPRMSKVMIHFDMNRSGAGMAWDFFIGSRSWLIDYLEDYDLWKFDLPETRCICAAVNSYPFNCWKDMFIDDLNVDSVRSRLLVEGEAILRAKDYNIDRLIKSSKRYCKIAGYTVPIANIPFVYASEAGNKMAVGEPFAAVYSDSSKGRIVSLRSVDPTGVDVSTIATKYGGGGHKHASGFKVPFDWCGDV